MIISITYPQLMKLHEYLKDEKKAHPSIWAAIQTGLKSKMEKMKFQVSENEKSLIKKVLAIKNPISLRTKHLRDAGAIKKDEWIGGNEFYHRKPKESFFERAEKYGGQIRMELNPRKLDRCVKQVQKKGSGVNDHAVCKSSLGMTKKKNPISEKIKWKKSKIVPKMIILGIMSAYPDKMPVYHQASIENINGKYHVYYSLINHHSDRIFESNDRYFKTMTDAKKYVEKLIISKTGTEGWIKNI